MQCKGTAPLGAASLLHKALSCFGGLDVVADALRVARLVGSVVVFVADFNGRIAQRECLGRLFVAMGGDVVAADDAVGELVGHELLHLVGTGTHEGERGFLASRTGERFFEKSGHGVIGILGNCDFRQVRLAGFTVGQVARFHRNVAGHTKVYRRDRNLAGVAVSGNIPFHVAKFEIDRHCRFLFGRRLDGCTHSYIGLLSLAQE